MATMNGIPNAGILKFVLTSFLGARIQEVPDEEGNEEKCVCIPIDRNGLRIGRTGKVSAYAFVVRTRNANMYGWTHYLKLKCNPNHVKKLNDLGYSAPYLGNIKPSNFVINKNGYQDTIRGQRVKVSDYE